MTTAVQATQTATTTYDISLSDLAGANMGQRDDLLYREQSIYRTPDGKLFNRQGTQLMPVSVITPTLSLNPLGLVCITGFTSAGPIPPSDDDGMPDGALYFQYSL